MVSNPTSDSLSGTNLEAAYGQLQAEVLQLRKQAQQLQKQLTLALEEKEAARERTAELAKANDALKRSVAHLVYTDSLQTFLHAVLLEATQAIAAVTGAVFVYNATAKTLQNTACVLHGEIAEIATDPRLKIWREPVPADMTEAWAVLSQKQQILWLDNNTPSQEHWEFSIPWHQQMGHQSTACIPLLIGEQVLGFLELSFTDHRPPSETSLEQCWTLARQTALAIRLTQLAEEAKQAAIAREQEETTQKRAAELAKANRVLKQSIDSLIRTAELEEFAGQILSEIIEMVQGANGVLFLYDQSFNNLRLYMAVSEGQVLRATELQTHGFDPFLAPVPAEKVQALTMLVSGEKPMLVNLEENPEQTYWEETIPWHRQKGHKATMCFPLKLANELWGFLGLAFRYVPEISPETLEFMQTLVHQLTLALHLTRVTEEKRQAAIVEERNRLAREIHDTLAQSFTSILVRLQTAQLSLPDHCTEAQQHITIASGLARSGLLEARRSVYELRPHPLENSNLVSALATYLQCMTDHTSIQSAFQQQGELTSIPDLIEVELFRIAQEAITNACKHAHARTLTVHLSLLSNRLQLSVEDDGRGFLLPSPEELKGFGLISMRERSHRIGGQFTIHTQLGTGTQILVSVELRNQEK